MITSDTVLEFLKAIDFLTKHAEENRRVSTRTATQGHSAPESGWFSGFFQKQPAILRDARFSKSDRPGVLYEANSLDYISDETLIGYGFEEGRWARFQEGGRHIVYVLEPPNSPGLQIQ